jgi:hypothetical protein
MQINSEIQERVIIVIAVLILSTELLATYFGYTAYALFGNPPTANMYIDNSKERVTFKDLQKLHYILSKK